MSGIVCKGKIAKDFEMLEIWDSVIQDFIGTFIE